MRFTIGMTMLIGVVLALSGCAGKHVEPVKVMVPTPCVSGKPSEPNYPQVQPDDGLFERVQKLLAEREMRIAYEGEQKAALSACE